jgi:hypothetical protein
MVYTCEWLSDWSGFLLVVHSEDGKEFSKLLSSKEQVKPSLLEAETYFSVEHKVKE